MSMGAKGGPETQGPPIMPPEAAPKNVPAQPHLGVPAAKRVASPGLAVQTKALNDPTRAGQPRIVEIDMNV